MIPLFLESLARGYLTAQVAEKHFGGADILINNAGFMFEKSLGEMVEDDWDHMMAVNLRAPVFLAKALLPQIAGGAAAASSTSA